MAHSYLSYYVGDHLLLEPTEKEKDPLLLTFSKVQNEPNEQDTPHMHAHLEFFYFESGNGIFEYNKKKFPLHAHDLLIVNAQHLHCQYSTKDDEPLVYYNLTVDRFALESTPGNALSGKPFEHHSFGDADNPIYRAICLIRDELEKKKYRYASKVHAIFNSLMIDILRLFVHRTEHLPSHGKELNNVTRLALVKGYMETHYTENLTLRQLCDMAMLQKSYFIRQFKEMYGFSPARYLNLIRIENAKLLLSNSEMNITEIAARVGFNHPSYFSEIFVKYEGVSPTHFRRITTKNEEWPAHLLPL